MCLFERVPPPAPPVARTISRRDVLRAAVLTPASGLVLAACAQDDPPLMSERQDDDRGTDTFDVQQLQEVLDRRAEALMAGDEDAYLARLDHSNQGLIARERLVFANLRQFDVEDIRFVTAQVGSFDPPGAAEASAPHTFTPVTKVVKLTADAGPDGVLGPGHSFEYVVDRRDGEWTVTDIVPLDYAGLRQRAEQSLSANRSALPAHAPWLQDELHVINVGNVWLVGDDSVTDLDRYAAEAEAEAERVEAIWGDRPMFPGHVLFFTRDEDAFGRWYEVGRNFDTIGLREGFAIPRRGIRANGEIYQGQFAGARNLIFLPAVEQQGWGHTLTMRHELTHTATMRAFGTGDGLATSPPTWAVEGFANFIMVRGDSSLEHGQRSAAASGFTGSLPDSDTFQEGGNEIVGANYAVSYTLFSFIEQIRDLETSIEFYAESIKWDDGARWGPGTYQPFVGTPAFDGLCQRVLGLGSAEFLDQWASYVRAGA